MSVSARLMMSSKRPARGFLSHLLVPLVVFPAVQKAVQVRAFRDGKLDDGFLDLVQAHESKFTSCRLLPQVRCQSSFGGPRSVVAAPSNGRDASQLSTGSARPSNQPVRLTGAARLYLTRESRLRD